MISYFLKGIVTLLVLYAILAMLGLTTKYNKQIHHPLQDKMEKKLQPYREKLDKSGRQFEDFLKRQGAY